MVACIFGWFGRGWQAALGTWLGLLHGWERLSLRYHRKAWHERFAVCTIGGVDDRAVVVIVSMDFARRDAF